MTVAVAGRRIAIHPFGLLRGLIIGSWILITVSSITWVAISSFKTNPEFFQSIWSWPQSLQLENYVRAWRIVRLKDYFSNSLFMTSTTTIANLLLASMAAYALSRFNFRGNRLILLAFVAGLGVPLQLLLIPLYFLLRDLHLLNSLPGLGVVYVTVWLPFSIFVLTGFFATLPSEIDEAAMIDGCSEFKIFWRIALPLASPGLLTVGILNALSIWNEYLLAMTFLRNRNLYTLPVGLYEMQVTMQYTADWTALFAGFIISLIPSFVIFITLQKYITAGLTVGALKD